MNDNSAALTNVLGWLCGVGTCLFANTIVLLTSTSQMQRLELITIGPQFATRVSARVAVAKPFTPATRIFPVAELNLSSWAETLGVGGNGAGLAVSVDADTVTAVLNADIVIDGARTVGAVQGFEAECNGNADTVVVAFPETSAAYKMG